MNAKVRLLAPALMVASGFASLGYQIVWTQQAGAWLGHEAGALLSVVAAFFGGLGLGAWVLGRRAERSAVPARWYAVLELVVGAWSLVVALSMEPAGRLLLALTGTDPDAAWPWAVAFGGIFVLLLPATAAMGATLPAMARLAAGWSRRGASVGALYAANTLGAVAGVLGTAFWIVPSIGLLRTAMLCAACNALAALIAWRLPVGAAPVRPALPAAARGLLPLLALTGFLGIGYEVLVVRVISQVAENTVYTFAQLLAVYLLGSALGAAAAPALRRRADDGVRRRRQLTQLLGVACLAGSATLWWAPELESALRAALGPGMGPALVAEAAVALAAFGMPTLAMGALFTLLADEAAAAGIGLGRVLAANTLGAALAPTLVGVLALPLAGPKPALLTLSLAYLLAGGVRHWRGAAAGAALVLALAVVAPPLSFVDIPAGGRLVERREGVLGTVSVVEDAEGVRRLHIDNRAQEGSSATRLADERQALLPLLLHPAPRHVLFLGLGTGVTARAAARDPALQVEAVELVPEVVQASAWFTEGDGSRLAVHVADARRFVRGGRTAFDVIVADNVHPARQGSAWLTTAEHFSAVRERLSPEGLFCQWLPLHQLDLATLRSIVAAFIGVFPDGRAMLATNSLQTPVLGLVARRGASGFDPAAVRARLNASAATLAPAGRGLPDEMAVLGSFVAGPAALRRFAAGAEPNTDDRPLVAYRAPRVTYAPASLPRDRLLALVDELGIEPAELLASDGGTGPRLAAYWQARNRFLALGRDVAPDPDPERMLAQLRTPLLGLLRTSPDFRPAREPLLRMAAALAHRDPAAAGALRQEIDAR